MSDCYILRVLKEGFCSQLMATKECFSYFYNVSVRYLEIFPGTSISEKTKRRMFTVTRLLHFKVVEWTNKRVYLVKVSKDNSVQEIQLERKNWYYSEIPICQTSMGNEIGM